MGWLDSLRKKKPDSLGGAGASDAPDDLAGDDVQRGDIRVFVVDAAPFRGARITAFSPSAGAIAVTDNGPDTFWISVRDGNRCDAPADAEAIDSTWQARLVQRDSADWSDVARWNRSLDDYVLAATKVGDAVLVDQARGAKEVRSLSWGIDDALERFWDRVDRSVRYAPVDTRLLVLDPTRFCLELVGPSARELTRIIIPLPMSFALTLASHASQLQVLHVIPEVDAVVLEMRDRHIYWWSLRDMLAVMDGALPREATWTYETILPRADLDARVEGKVTVVAAGRTFVRAGDKSITLHVTGPEKGDRVTLEGRLWDDNGVTQYARLVLGDGRVVELPGAPKNPVDITTMVTRTVGPGAGANDAKAALTRLEKTLTQLQELGLLGGVTQEMLATYADGGVETARDLLDAYCGTDEARMIEVGLLTHDWRFGQETDDVIAEICDRIGGEPLFEQVEVVEDAIAVRDRSGTMQAIDAESLDEVVYFFNETLETLGDARRFFLFEDEGDQITYLLTTEDAATKLRELGLPLEDGAPLA